ncbi:MAG TPA: DUF6502 family protein [Rhodopila sp.]
MPAQKRPLSLPPVSLLAATRRLLRPLVRLMMQSGVTFPVLADSLRRLYVEIAVSDLLTDPKARTDSRISLLTGVHRKEIRRLREMPADRTEPPAVVTLAGQIVARWVGTAPFIDPTGHPRALPRTRNEATGAGPSFDELVAAVTTDIRPRTVLDDLLGHGSVFLDENDRVHLNAEAFIPRPGGEEQLFYFGRNLHDHVAASVANITAPDVPPFLDRSVHYDRLTPSQVQTLREFARAAAMRVLLDVNRLAQELTEAPGETDLQQPRRINFGIYVFDEDERTAARGGP